MLQNTDDILATLRAISIRPDPQTEAEAEIRAYKDWAIQEMYYRVTDKPYEDPVEIITWFRLEMDGYSRIPKMQRKEINPFVQAMEAADDVLAMLEYPRED